GAGEQPSLLADAGLVEEEERQELRVAHLSLQSIRVKGLLDGGQPVLAMATDKGKQVLSREGGHPAAEDIGHRLGVQVLEGGMVALAQALPVAGQEAKSQPEGVRVAWGPGLLGVDDG